MRRSTVLALALLVACGTPTGPIVVPSDDLPFGIERTPEVAGTEPASVRVVVMFVRRGRLARVQRTVQPGVEIAEAIRALLAGPTKAERERGLISHAPQGTRLLDVQVVSGIARVDLSGEFQLPAEPQIILLRVAQVVSTVVRSSGVTAVTFSIEGSAVAVVTEGGEPVDRPVTAADYASVQPL